MDYFQELLNSYQLIKKRKFSINIIAEQAAINPNASIEDALMQAQNTQGTASTPAPYSGDIGVYKSVRGQKISVGIARLTPGAPMPGGARGAGYINQDQINSLSPEARQKIEALMRGEQEQDQGQPEQQAAEQDPTGMAAAPQPMMPLPLSQDPIVAQALQNLHMTMQKLKGDMDSGSVRMEKGGTSLLDEAIKRFYWGGLKSGSFASKLDLAKIAYRMGGELTYENMPPDFAAQGIANLEKIFNTFRELDSGKFTTEKAQELRDLIKLEQNGTGMLLRSAPGSDNGMIIRWETADSFYGSLMTNLQDKLNRWGESQKDGTEAEDVTIPTGSLSGGGKNFNNLRGVVSERFQAISVILRRGIVAEAMCKKNPKACKDATANKTLALGMLRKLYEENRDSLIPAFEIVDNLRNHEIPGDVETQRVADEIMAVLDFLKIEFPKKLTEGAATPEDIARYSMTANTIVDRMFNRLIRVDAKTVMLRNPTFVGETGQSEANSKKTDTTEFYDSIQEATLALEKMGYTPEEAKNLLVPANTVVGMYGGEEQFAKLTGAPIEKIKQINKKGKFVLLNGIKSYTRTDPVSLGSGSVTETHKKFTTNNPSISAFTAKLGIDPNSFKNIAQEFAVAHEEFEMLKDPNKYPLKQGETLVGVVKDKIERLGLSRRYPGLSKGSQEQKIKNLTEIQRSMIFDKYDSIVKKNPRAANNYMAMIIMSAAAADVNQQTEVRYLHTGETYSFDHNDAVVGPLKGLKDGTTRIVRSGGTIHVVDAITEEPLLTYSTAIGDGKIKGSVHLPVNRMKQLAKVKKQTVQASTELMINFLMGQKQLLEQLLTKYQ